MCWHPLTPRSRCVWPCWSGRSRRLLNAAPPLFLLVSTTHGQNMLNPTLVKGMGVVQFLLYLAGKSTIVCSSWSARSLLQVTQEPIMPTTALWPLTSSTLRFTRLCVSSFCLGDALVHGHSSVLSLTPGVPWAATHGTFRGSLGGSDGGGRLPWEGLRDRWKDLAGREHISSRTSGLLWLHCVYRHFERNSGQRYRILARRLTSGLLWRLPCLLGRSLWKLGVI